MANEIAKPVEISTLFPVYDNVDIGVDMFVSAGVMYSLIKNTLMGSHVCPAIHPQCTCCTANVHNVNVNCHHLSLAHLYIRQVTVVLVVVVGQLPQFDDRML